MEKWVAFVATLLLATESFAGLRSEAVGPRVLGRAGGVLRPARWGAPVAPAPVRRVAQLPGADLGGLRAAAQGGDPRAQRELASRLERGEGVPRDLEEAARWYGRAAGQGDEEGRRGLERVLPRALAAALGDLGYAVPGAGDGPDLEKLREVVGAFRRDLGLPADDRVTLDALDLATEHRELGRGFEAALGGASRVGLARLERETSRSVRGAGGQVPAAEPPRGGAAVAIGVAQHRSPALGDSPFAAHDAETVAGFLIRGLGYPVQRVHLLLDPRRAQLDRLFGTGDQPGRIDSELGGGDLLVYYSGSALVVPGTGRRWLLPYDADPSRLVQTGYPLDRLRAAAERVGARRLVLVLDTAFEPAEISAPDAAARVAEAAPSSGAREEGDILVLGAGPGESRNSLPALGHGLFTYWWLRAASGEADRDGDGAVTVGELRAYLEERLGGEGRGDSGAVQTPLVLGPAEAEVTALPESASAPGRARASSGDTQARSAEGR